MDFARAMLARLGHFWSVAPAASVYSARCAVGDAGLDRRPLWLALLLGLLRPRALALAADRRAAFAIGLTLVHLFFWTDLRMRAPIVPAIALMAAGAPLPALDRQATAPRASRPSGQGTRDGLTDALPVRAGNGRSA